MRAAAADDDGGFDPAPFTEIPFMSAVCEAPALLVAGGPPVPLVAVY
jgi:hypothetical protein